MRRAAKRDAGEEALIQAAEAMGAWVISLSQPVDLIVCHRGFLTFVEVKSKNGKLTDSQKSFFAYCKHHNAPVAIWRNLDDVRALLGAEALAP